MVANISNVRRKYLCVFPIAYAWWNFPFFLFLHRHFSRGRMHDGCWRRWRSSWNLFINPAITTLYINTSGICICSLFLFSQSSYFRSTYLNFGGSRGSTCASTILITLCFAPELNDCPCCDGV